METLSPFLTPEMSVCVSVCAVLCCNFTMFYRCYFIIWIFEIVMLASLQLLQQRERLTATRRFLHCPFHNWVVICLTLLTHLLEDISEAADLAQQLLIGDWQVMVGHVPFPEKDNGQERKPKRLFSASTNCGTLRTLFLHYLSVQLSKYTFHL